MTDTECEALIRDVLAGIAPESADMALAPDEDLRAALDLDSMDFMNFVIALHERSGAAIPEADYPQFFTLGSAVAYLAGKAR